MVSQLRRTRARPRNRQEARRSTLTHRLRNKRWRKPSWNRWRLHFLGGRAVGSHLDVDDVSAALSSGIIPPFGEASARSDISRRRGRRWGVPRDRGAAEFARFIWVYSLSLSPNPQVRNGIDRLKVPGAKKQALVLSGAGRVRAVGCSLSRTPPPAAS